jgi:L-ascorbate metabolism protein UlaG (beta-lactamase superfamily)
VRKLSEGRLASIKELYSMGIEDKEIAFLFFQTSGVLLRTQELGLVFDIAGSLKAREMNEIKADFQFYTHIHGDHFSLPKAQSFYKKSGAHLIGPGDVIEAAAKKIPAGDLTEVEPSRTSTRYKVKGLDIWAVRGVHSGPFSQYRVKMKGVCVFHAGDSGYFGMGKQAADIAFLPTGMPSPWCAPEVALAMARNIKPKIAVATHGNDKQRQEFKRIMKSEMPEVEVIVPEEFKVVSVRI